MSSPSTVFVGPSVRSLQSTVYEAADDIASPQPESILFIDENDFRRDSIRQHWARDFDPLRMTLTDLRTTLMECYEELKGPNTRLPAVARRRLLARALHQTARDETHPAIESTTEAFTELVTLLEEAGIDSLADLEAATFPRADHASVAEAFDRYQSLSAAYRPPGVATQLEMYQTVLDADVPLADLLDNVDVIILSGHHARSPLERRFIRQLHEEFPLFVLLPQAGSASRSGVDATLADEVAFYRDLGLDIDFRAPRPATSSDTAVEHMYRPTTNSTHAPEIRWLQAPTPDREIREVARQVRQDLADGVPSDDILVVVPELITYLDQLQDTFEQSGIDFVPHTNRLLYQLNVGRAVLDCLELCHGRGRTDHLASLATNPIVELGSTAQRKTMVDLAHRLPTNDTGSLLEELDDGAATEIETLLEDAAACRNADSGDLLADFAALLQLLGVPDRIDRLRDDASGFDARMEVRGYDRVTRLLEVQASIFDEIGSSEPLDELDDALQRLRVPPPANTPDNVVDVVGPREAYMAAYEHLYLVGLTAEAFPIDPDRPRFYDELIDALPVEPEDPRQRARHQFATMLTNAETVTITTPETSVDDESLLESPILDEFRRVNGIEPDPIQPSHATAEDVQRSLSRLPTNEVPAAVEQATEAGTFTADQRARILAGSACAASRASTDLTAFDGQLDPATVDGLHPPDERRPMSPTGLGEYARCGFRYYANRVLDLDDPKEFSLEPGGLEVGSLVHDVLERFFSALQDTPGDIVHLGDYALEDLEALLLSTALDARDDLEYAFDDTFADRVLAELLAGLGPEDDNPYYGSEHAHDGEDRGLFVRLLDAELARESHPFAFEVDLSLDDDPFELETPGGPIALTGRIDRLDIQPDDAGRTGLVLDYKTGTATTKLSLEGLEFQLPVYALAGSRRFPSDVETVDAAYYSIQPPTTVRQRSTLGAYLARYTDRGDALEDFLDRTVPEWLATIDESIAAGAYQPTVLKPADAGCRHCAYQDICDVRPHHRGDAAEALAAAEHGYVPPRATPESLGEFYGGEHG